MLSLKSIELIIGIGAGLVTIGTVGWKISADYIQLKQRVDRVEQEAAEFRHYVLPAPKLPITASQLAGAWDIFYAGRQGRLGGQVLGPDLLEFKGNIYRSPKQTTLNFEGKGLLKEVDGRFEIEYSFATKGSKKGEEWHGTGVLYVISLNFLQGWFDDQQRRHERIEVKRAF